MKKVIEIIAILGISYLLVGVILESAKKSADEYSSNITRFETRF